MSHLVITRLFNYVSPKNESMKLLNQKTQIYLDLLARNRILIVLFERGERERLDWLCSGFHARFGLVCVRWVPQQRTAH